MKWMKAALICGLLFSCAFGLISLVFYFGEWDRLLFVSLFGFFIGLIAAPEIDKKAFPNPAIFQVFSGLMAGLVIGVAFSLDIDKIILLTILGGVLGWLAPYWIKYVQIP